MDKITLKTYLNLPLNEKSDYLQKLTTDNIDDFLSDIEAYEDFEALDSILKSRIWLLSVEYDEIAAVRYPDFMLQEGKLVVTRLLSPKVDPKQEKEEVDKMNKQVQNLKTDMVGGMTWNYDIIAVGEGGPHSESQNFILTKPDFIQFLNGYRAHLKKTNALWFERNERNTTHIVNLDKAVMFTLRVMLSLDKSKIGRFYIEFYVAGLHSVDSWVIDIPMDSPVIAILVDLNCEKGPDGEWPYLDLGTFGTLFLNKKLICRIREVRIGKEDFSFKYGLDVFSTIQCDSASEIFSISNFMEIYKSSVLAYIKSGKSFLGEEDLQDGLPPYFKKESVDGKSNFPKSSIAEIKKMVFG